MVTTEQFDLQDAVQKAIDMTTHVDSIKVALDATAAELGELKRKLATCLSSGAGASTSAQQEAERRLDEMTVKADYHEAQFKAERERRQTAELALDNVKALLKSLQEESTRAAERHTGEFNNLTLNLREALAEKQALSDEHVELRGSLRAEVVAKEVVSRKLDRVTSNIGDTIIAKVEESTRSLAKEVDQAKKERADMRSAKAAVAADFHQAKVKLGNLEAAVTTLKKEKEDQAAKHKAEVNRLRDDMHVLRAKQATPPVESKQPKSKAAKKKALALQAYASINANDTPAEGASTPKTTTHSETTSPTTTNIKARWASLDEAVPDSGPSPALPSPDSRGQRGVAWGPDDAEYDVARSSSWAVGHEWQEVLPRVYSPRPRPVNRGFNRMRSGRRHQHRA